MRVVVRRMLRVGVYVSRNVCVFVLVCTRVSMCLCVSSPICLCMYKEM